MNFAKRCGKNVKHIKMENQSLLNEDIIINEAEEEPEMLKRSFSWDIVESIIEAKFYGPLFSFVFFLIAYTITVLPNQSHLNDYNRKILSDEEFVSQLMLYCLNFN